MEKLEITLLSERSIVPLSEINKSEGRRGEASEGKINFDLSTLNMKYLVGRKNALQCISGLEFSLTPFPSTTPKKRQDWQWRLGIKLYRCYSKDEVIIALAGVAQWIEHWPAYQMVADSIPSQGMYLGCRPDPQ